MTAEVLIMRQNGIIFAADKAVTTPNDKSYTTSKKIFNLDKDFPVTMMINGHVDFEGDIEKIKNRFIEFLEKNTKYTSKEEYIDMIRYI